jgi:hypothetical protein
LDNNGAPKEGSSHGKKYGNYTVRLGIDLSGAKPNIWYIVDGMGKVRGSFVDKNYAIHVAEDYYKLDQEILNKEIENILAVNN